MSERKLRRQRVIFYISRSLENVPKAFQTAAARRDYYNTLIDQLETEFEHSRLLLEIFGQAGAHPAHVGPRPFPALQAVSQSVAQRPVRLSTRRTDSRRTFDSGKLLAQRRQRPERFRFLPRWHYHSLIVLTRWPRTTYPRHHQRLTNLRLLDYTITVNVDPLPISQEISKEEKEHDRVAGDYASEKKISLLTVMEKSRRRFTR